MGEIYTVDQVAERLQVHRNTVMNYLREGILEGSKLKREWRIREEDLEAFLEDRKPAAKENE